MVGRRVLGTGGRVSSRLIPDVTAGAPDVLSGLSSTGGVLLSGRWSGGAAIVADHPIEVRTDDDAPFDALALPALEDAPAGAVGGGWFGWLGFTAGRRGRATSHWSLYPNVLRFDGTHWYDEAIHGLVSEAELARRRRTLAELLRPGVAGRFHVGPMSAHPGRTGYERAVDTAIEHIRAGDIYQVNVCTRLDAPFTGDPSALHAQLLTLEPAYGAYLATPTRTLASASPELFLRRHGREVVSSPIKGTRPRLGADDRAQHDALRDSLKDRAENVMIVDLMRNDLSRVAETGSVHVPSLLRLEAHPGVWHLVSDVAATLRAEVTDAELLQATFPPGSVTGAPKVRALEIIDEVETVERGVYTGAIGYVSPSAGLELSVAIRTFEIADGRAHLGVGAGITAGSDPSGEWLECLDKARALLRAARTQLA